MNASVGTPVSNGRPFLNSLIACDNSKPLAAKDAAHVLQSRFGELRMGTATAGDHYPIYDFLFSIFHAPSATEFQAQLEEPWYEPTDRIVIRNGARIVAHLRMHRCNIHFGSMVLPAVGLSELATEPEFRGLKCATTLIDGAQQQMAAESAVMGVVRTTAPTLFARQGWVPVGRHSYSLAGTREILAQLSAMETSREPALCTVFGESRPLQLSTRIWRHVERGALMRLYESNTTNSHGPLVRHEDYWRWLVSRRAYDNIYVVIEGPDKLDLNETPIIGYAVTRDGRIVEMMTDPTRPYAITQLLTRVCGDAIERDISAIRLDASPENPLHQLFVSAGGQFRRREVDGGQVIMAKLLDPWTFLQHLSPILFERAKASGIGLPFELGLVVGQHRLCLELGRRSLKIQQGRVGRSYISCSLGELEQLMLGHLDVTQSISDGVLAASTRNAGNLASILFPQLPYWRPPLDELQA